MTRTEPARLYETTCSLPRYDITRLNSRLASSKSIDHACPSPIAIAKNRVDGEPRRHRLLLRCAGPARRSRIRGRYRCQWRDVARAGSERGRRNDPDGLHDLRSRVVIPVRERTGVGDGIARVEGISLTVEMNLVDPAQDDPRLFSPVN